MQPASAPLLYLSLGPGLLPSLPGAQRLLQQRLGRGGRYTSGSSRRMRGSSQGPTVKDTSKCSLGVKVLGLVAPTFLLNLQGFECPIPKLKEVQGSGRKHCGGLPDPGLDPRGISETLTFLFTHGSQSCPPSLPRSPGFHEWPPSSSSLSYKPLRCNLQAFSPGGCSFIRVTLQMMLQGTGR